MKLGRSHLIGFQIPAHFPEATGSCSSSTGGRGDREGAPERVAEMAVTGEAQVERQGGQIRFLLDQPFQGGAQTQSLPVLMNRQPRFAPENAREMKRRTVNRAGDVLLQSQIFCEPCTQEQAS